MANLEFSALESTFFYFQSQPKLLGDIFLFNVILFPLERASPCQQKWLEEIQKGRHKNTDYD